VRLKLRWFFKASEDRPSWFDALLGAAWVAIAAWYWVKPLDVHASMARFAFSCWAAEYNLNNALKKAAAPRPRLHAEPRA
jgi:hypothetical protein